MKKTLIAAFAALMLLASGAAYADSIHGRCIGAGGEKCLKHHRISTSWNSKTARINPSRGTYELDFGGSVGKKITVYCDGSKVGTVTVNGRTAFTVRCD